VLLGVDGEVRVGEGDPALELLAELVRLSAGSGF
jgi:hypothetical protein